MPDETMPAAEPAGPGRPSLNIGQREIAKILELMEGGMGRALALREAGFKHYRTFTKLMRDDPEFRDHVLTIERARLEFAELRLYEMVNGEEPDHQVIGAYIRVRQTTQGLIEARRARRRAEAIEDKKLALEERRVAAAEGKKDDDEKPLPLERFTPEQLAAWRDLNRILLGDDAEPPA